MYTVRRRCPRTHCTIDADVISMSAVLCLIFTISRLRATSDKYFWVKSSSSVDLEWLAAGFHRQIHSEFHQGLRACIKANGGHFEYWVWLTNEYLLIQYAAPVVKYQQTDNISGPALLNIQKALFYVVNCSKCFVTFCWRFWELIDKIMQSICDKYVSHLIL